MRPRRPFQAFNRLDTHLHEFTRLKQVDLAHEDSHPFQAFTRACLQWEEDVCLVQLHGFAAKSRREPAARKASMIVSNGTRTPAQWFRQGTHQLARRLPRHGLLAYPFETSELGGRTNAQARLVRQFFRDGFLQLEMSGSFRRLLGSQRLVRRELLEGLREVYRSKRLF